MTKFVKGLSGRPVANDLTSDSDLGVDALRNALGHDSPDSPTDDVGNPGFEIGITAPTGEVSNPGFEVGISTPMGDVDSVGDAAGGPGIFTLETVPEFAIADDHDDVTSQKGGGATADPNSSNPETGNIGVLLPIGTNPDGSHFFSGNRNVDATLIGSKWGTLNLTYSFPTSGTNYNGVGLDSNGVNSYHIDAGTQQQAAARAAFAQIMAATGIVFTEITETDSVHANIRISQSADQDVPSAYGGFPSDTRGVAGDIWFGRNNQPYYDMAYQGTWGFSTMMHEIGHTMGLKHGHQDYTNSDLSFFFGTTPRPGSQSLTPDRDGQAWSLMTYSPAPGVGQPFAGDKISQPQTYMQYDLAALQYMYGANYNTNNGDSEYTFSQTTGEMFINGVGQGAPAGNRILLTIWDGGGNDTINASNYANGVTIDLRPGEFSTVDQAQLVNHLAYQNVGVAMAPGNIAMSLLYNNDARSLIENATGGVGNDIFVGNTANNILDGGAGGNDSVIFTNPTGVTVTLNDTNTDVIVTHDGETDTLRSIENIGGTSGNDTITGNSLGNVLTGGSGGTDVLNGGGGADVLIGGGYSVVTTFVPGALPSQPDITKAQATNNGSIGTAVNTAGFYDVDANANIANATTIPHATINATATGGTVEYYRIDVTAAGAQAIFDIDGAGSLNDSIIELVNSAGTVLASNDTGPGDPGTTVNDDAYITYTFAAAGTYYIRVGRWITGNTAAQPMLAGQTYQLNISLQGAAGSTIFTADNTSSLVANGGEGNDIVVGTLAGDSLIGGNGNDTVSFVNAFSGGSTTGVTVDLNLQQGAAQNTVAAGNDTLLGFENLIGSALNDTLTGDANDNVIEGGLGNDVLAGGNGNDTASYAGATAGVTVSLALQGAGQATGSAGTDTLSGFENLLGSGFSDSLTGDAAANILTGGAGDDTLNPGANAGGTVDLLDGGIGTDTASFAGVASGVTVTLNGANDVAAAIVGGTIATLRSIENLTGSSNADTLTGDGNNNAIEGGLGDDTLDGGAGTSDTLVFSGSTAATVNLATLTAQATGWGSDTISNFENVRTGSGADNITGDGNDNTLFDGGGADTYNGAGGVDTVDYTNIAGALTVNLTLAGAQAASTGGDTLTAIENVNGSLTGVNTLTGNTLANRLTGGAAADLMVGGDGADTLIGGAGNDILLAGNNSLVTAIDDGSADTVEGGLGNDYLSGGQGNDILRGGDGDDTLVGGSAVSNPAFFTGADGGNDTYEGGDGTDHAIMVYDTRAGVGMSTIGISFDLGSLEGNSAITFDGVNVGSLTSIERVTFRGTNVDDSVRGSGFVDSLTGNAGNDMLDGWIGNDLLSGGLGNDILTGGEGIDTVTYVNSLAGVNVDLRILVAQDTGGENIDTLSGIEYLTGSAFGDTLRGDDGFNLIIDTGVGAGATALSQTDSLFGYAGNDSLLVTRAAGAVATNINMDGGDGDDFIELRSGSLGGANAATNLSGLINQTYSALGSFSTNRSVDVVTVDAGNGADRVVLQGVDSAVVSLGAGNDILSINTLGTAGFNDHDITTGAGQDTIWLAGSSATQATLIARANVVHDFTAGDAGDRLEFRTAATPSSFAATSWVNTTNFLGLVSVTQDMFDSGHLRLFQVDSNLLFQVDRDGSANGASFVTIMNLEGGYTGGFTAFNFDGMIGQLNLLGQGALDETLTGASKADTLSGGDGNDVLNGLDGNDMLNGGAGVDTLNGGNNNDTLNGGTGNDALNGGAGFDTATYAGNAADYAVVYEYDGNGNVIGFLSVTDNNAGDGDEGADTLNSVEAVSFGGVVLNATQPIHLFDGDTLIGTFNTIQAAINAAGDGDTITVASGTYQEQLTVDGKTGLTIRAADGADVTVLSPANLAVNGASDYYGIAVRAVIAVTDSTNVHIENIKVDGNFSGDTTPGSNGDELSGIAFLNSSGGIDGVDIDDTGNSPGGGLFGLQHGSGLFIDNSGLTTGNDVSVTDSTITDFQKTGALIIGTVIVFTGNTITGIGATGLTAQNGVQITLSEGTLDGNAISGIGYTVPVGGTYYYSSGIIAYEPSGALSFDGNTITGVGAAGEFTALDLSDTEGVAVGFTNNVIADATNGIVAYTYVGGTTGLDAQPDFTGTTFTGITGNGIYFDPEDSAGAPFSTTTDFSVTGTDFADVLAGSAGDDVFAGGGGTDRLAGREGDDTLGGGGGTDTAVYAGNRADYTIVQETGPDGRVTGFLAVTDDLAGDGDEGADTLTSVEQLEFGNITLDTGQPVQLFDGDNLVGTFGTIQAAVDASADGNTIRVAAGVYTENVNFHTAVTVLGAHAGDAGSTRNGATAAGETTLIGRHDITATGGAVVLDGLRFVNNASTSNGGPSDPILQIASGGDHVVTNSVFYSEVAGGARPTPDDRAISMPVLADGTITISDNYFTGASVGGFSTASWGRAVWFDGGGADLVVTGNTIEYARTGLNLDMTGDSSVTVSGNLFTTTGTAMAVGVDMVGLTVTDNDFANAGEEFNFRNQTGDVTFDAETAVDAQTGDFINVLGGSGNDNLSGTAFNDLLDGNQLVPANADNDVLDGRGGDDVLLGRAGNDTLIGGIGSDQLLGGVGDDVLTGGADDDLLDGEAGIDTAVFADNNLTYTSTVIGWLVGSSEGNDFLQRTEIVVDGDGDRNLLVGGTAFANLQTALNAAENNDTVRLAAGTYSGPFTYSDSGLTIIAQPNAQINGTFTPTGSDGITIAGANLNDTITTGAGDDRVLFNVTTGGSDTVNLDGGADAVILSGNAGQIRLTFTSAEIGNNNANDSNTMANQDGGLAVRLQAEDGAGALTGPVSRFDDEGIVFVAGAGQTFDVRDLVSGVQRGDQFEVVSLGTLAADVMTAVQPARSYYFNGGMGDDSITGGNANDFLVGGAGSDTLSGGAGIDTHLGGGGNDIYVVDNSDDVVIESTGGGTRDAVYALVNYTLEAGVDVEVLSAANQAGTEPLELVGNELNQEIYGNAGANILEGGGGSDYLIGLGGNDFYLVTGPGDVVVENVGEGARDAIYTSGDYTMAAGLDVEVLSAANQAGTSALNLTGSTLGQEIYGNDGANVIDGGGGADLLVGLGGNDVYYVDGTDDYVAESLGGGRDVVYATASHALAANQEVEVLSTTSQVGTGAIDLTGNNLANELYGNDGVNVLNGGAGADYLQGFGGADTFAFTTALGGGNVDQIVDFVAGTDKIALDDAVFTGLTPGALAAGAFVTGSAAGDADDRIIYNSATGQLFFDADGNGAGAAVQFATLSPGLTLAASDFMVI